MSPVGVRRALHHVYSVCAITLMATGLFLTLPDLRAWLIGGYGRQILDIHMWAGWIFLAAPPLALALGAKRLLRFAQLRLNAPGGLSWRKVHITSSLLAGFLLGLSGLLIWWDPREMPRWLSNLSSEVHLWLSWFVIAELAVHLIAARSAIVQRARVLLGLAEEEEQETAPS